MTTNILPTTTKTVDITTLSPHPDNARQGNTDLIAQSLEHNGQYRPLVVQTSTGHVLAGNHTLAAAHQLGWTQVAATFIDVDDTAAKKILLADNRTSDTATYDDQLLAELLASLNDDLIGTGYDPGDLDALTDSFTPPDLDDLADKVGQPKHDDGWPSINMRVPHTVKAAWISHCDTHNNDEAAAMANLLGVEYTEE